MITKRRNKKRGSVLFFLVTGIFSVSVLIFGNSGPASADADSTLYFSQSDVNIPATSFSVADGDNFILHPTINTGVNNVSIVSLKMTFDNAKLTLTDLTIPSYNAVSTPFANLETAGVINGSDPNVLINFLANANSTGNINFDISVGSANPSAQGIFSIATLTFTAKATGDAIVAFDPTTGAAADGESGNVVSGTTPTTVTITPPSPRYNVGGTVSGLSGTVFLQNNGGNDLSVSSDGPFTFTNAINDGSVYSVSVLTQPTGQTCTVTNYTGTISGADATDVVVSCVDSAAPIITLGVPHGQQLALGTTQATINVTTDENATCAWSVTSGLAYASMNTFDTTGTTQHSFGVTGLADGTSYGYFVRCQDTATVPNISAEKLVAFSVVSVSAQVVTSIEASSDSSKDSSDSHKKEKIKARSVSNSKKNVKFGAILIQRGKKFSKNSLVMLYFSKKGGGYYPPMKVMTSSTGSFMVKYKVGKPKGLYNWYAVDTRTGRKSKLTYYKVK